jgi:dTDP-glucose 4,6-dehydratase
MKILVTGGRGVIGSSLVDMLSEDHYVIACDLMHGPDETGVSLLTNDPMLRMRYRRCDIVEFRQMSQLFDSFGPIELVYNCAAEFGRWNGEDFYEQLWRTNVIGTKNLLRLQEKVGFKLVHFSSSEVYGDWPECMVETVMDEYAIRQMNDYAMTKWVNEMQVHNSMDMYATESVIVRLFNTYGPGEYYSPYRSVNCRFLYCALHGLPWTVFQGHQRTSTYIEDATRTLANIADNFNPGETYNIGGGHLHSIEELSDVVLKVTGADPALVRFEDSEPMTTQRKVVDVSKAKKDLGHVDTCDLETGMKRTADWMKEVYL